jgi:hypothetical protein
LHRSTNQVDSEPKEVSEPSIAPDNRDFAVGSDFSMCESDSSDFSVTPIITGMEQLRLDTEEHEQDSSQLF